MAVPGMSPFAQTGEPLYPTTNTAQAAQAGNATIAATPGRLFGVTITATGTNPLVIQDGATGTEIFGTAASPAVGYNPISGGNSFGSLVVIGSATNPAIVCHYSLKGTP